MARIAPERGEGQSGGVFNFVSRAYGGNRARYLMSVEVTFDSPATGDVVVIRLSDDIRGQSPMLLSRLHFESATSSLFLPTGKGVPYRPRDGVQVQIPALAAGVPRVLVHWEEEAMDDPSAMVGLGAGTELEPAV